MQRPKADYDYDYDYDYDHERDHERDHETERNRPKRPPFPGGGPLDRLNSSHVPLALVIVIVVVVVVVVVVVIGFWPFGFWSGRSDNPRTSQKTLRCGSVPLDDPIAALRVHREMA